MTSLPVFSIPQKEISNFSFYLLMVGKNALKVVSWPQSLMGCLSTMPVGLLNCQKLGLLFFFFFIAARSHLFSLEGVTFFCHFAFLVHPLKSEV